MRSGWVGSCVTLIGNKTHFKFAPGVEGCSVSRQTINSKPTGCPVSSVGGEADLLRRGIGRRQDNHLAHGNIVASFN